MEALRLEGVAKSFGGLGVLQNVTFQVEEGERRAIIGPNGAGKTTLFNIISGELAPTGGRIYAYGQPITLLPAYKRARQGLSKTFQKNNLFFNLSALENVILSLQQFRGVSFQMWRRLKRYRGLEAQAREMLSSWGLEEKAERPVRELSYGEQRQLEVIMGLAMQPRLLLLDEPTAGMSARETAAMAQMIKNLPREITVLIIEHDMDVVFDLADRVTVLYYGQVLVEGVAEEIKADERVREVYLGRGEKHAGS